MDNLPITDELYKGLLLMNSIQLDKVSRIRQIGNTLFNFNIKLGDAKAKMYKRNGEIGKEELVAFLFNQPTNNVANDPPIFYT